MYLYNMHVCISVSIYVYVSIYLRMYHVCICTCVCKYVCMYVSIYVRMFLYLHVCLQERYRYNSLHSAAIKGQTDVAELVLNYLNDPKFFAKLYPSDTSESRLSRMSFTLDLYLNTPDKGVGYFILAFPLQSYCISPLF